MKIIKRTGFLTLFCVLAVVLSFTACNHKASSTAKKVEEKKTETPTPEDLKLWVEDGSNNKVDEMALKSTDANFVVKYDEAILKAGFELLKSEATEYMSTADKAALDKAKADAQVTLLAANNLPDTDTTKAEKVAAAKEAVAEAEAAVDQYNLMKTFSELTEVPAPVFSVAMASGAVTTKIDKATGVLDFSAVAADEEFTIYLSIPGFPEAIAELNAKVTKE